MQRRDHLPRPCVSKLLSAPWRHSRGRERYWCLAKNRRQAARVPDCAGRVRVKAEKKLGDKLAELPKARGGGTGANTYRAASTKSEPAAPTLADLGVDRKRSAAAQKLAEMPKGRLEEIFVELSEKDKTISPSAVLQAERQHVKTEKKHAVAAAAILRPAGWKCRFGFLLD